MALDDSVISANMMFFVLNCSVWRALSYLDNSDYKIWSLDRRVKTSAEVHGFCVRVNDLRSLIDGLIFPSSD